jgi:general secretion pathway protein G
MHDRTAIAERRRRRQRGFTLIELLVVLGIVALLAGLVAPRVVQYLGGARSKAAEVQIRGIVQALELYRLDVGRYPTASEGLGALVRPPTTGARWGGPYLDREAALLDPWGVPYGYRLPGRRATVEVFTLGADRAEGGEGEARDVGNW